MFSVEGGGENAYSQKRGTKKRTFPSIKKLLRSPRDGSYTFDLRERNPSNEKLERRLNLLEMCSGDMEMCKTRKTISRTIDNRKFKKQNE